MIPIELTLEGFYSYRQPQTIQFDPLTSSQLFGIFGAVGSGKSSILEAITLALYDQSERLNARDQRTYNMMNLQSDRLRIDFTCWAGPGMRTRYRFLYQAARNSRQFQKIGSTEHRVFEERNGEWIPLEHPDVKAIVGMKYEHFCKTIIIPQGKFREFVELTPSFRTDMMLELFQLERFDLQQACQRLQAQANKALENLSGQLTQLEGYTAEGLEALREEHRTALPLAELASQEAQRRRAAFEERRQLAQWAQALAETQRQLGALEAQRPGMAARRQALRQYELAQTHFQARLQQLDEQERRAQAQSKALEALSQQLQEAQGHHAQARQVYEQEAQAQSQQEEKRQQLRDLEHIIEWQALRGQEQEKTQALEALRIQAEAAKQRWQAAQAQQRQAEQALDALQQSLPDMEAWQTASEWFGKQGLLRQQDAAAAAEAQEAGRKQEALLGQVAEEAAAAGWTWPAEQAWQSLPGAWEARLRELEAEVSRAEAAHLRLLAQAEMRQHAHRLQPGEPCPLCGSLKHPAPLAADDGSALALSDKALRQCREARRQGQEAHSQALRWRERAEEGQSRLAALVQRQQEAEAALTLHAQQAPPLAQGLDEAAFKLALDEAKARQRQAKEADQAARRGRELAQAAQEEAQRGQEALQLAMQGLAALQGQATAVRQQVKVLDAEKMLGHGPDRLLASLEKGRAQLAQAAQAWEAAQARLAQASQAEAALQGRREEAARQLEELQALLASQREEAEALAKAQGYAAAADVRAVLSQGLQVEREREALERFEEQLREAAGQAAQLEGQLQGRRAGEAEVREAQEAWEAAKREAEARQQQVGSLAGRLEIYERGWAEASTLQAEREVLEVRKAHLDQLGGLFKGKKFVEFVAQTYLEHLVKVAQARFFRLTQQTLGLELDEKGNFVVRDYLNEGRVRLLKTLSGGQLFQASLCLALALAEHIQQLNQSEKSFFFLDEGFGTLDKQALRTVFDTLKALRQENRIVGVISHVEALQQEIEVALVVENDERQGSVIRKSWEMDGYGK